MDSLPKKTVALEQLMPLIREQLERGKTVTFAPRGVSMLPLLRQGKDAVVLSPVESILNKNDIILYRRDNGRYILHRIVEVGPTYTCMGDNQTDPEYGVCRQQIIGVVSAVIRQNKRVEISKPAYRIYCAMLDVLRPMRRFWHTIKRARRNA